MKNVIGFQQSSEEVQSYHFLLSVFAFDFYFFESLYFRNRFG